MVFALTQHEALARARADLRMGRPVAIRNETSLGIAIAAETITQPRLHELRQLGDVDLTITARRAETLRARAYDGDLARIRLPEDANVQWIGATADPAADLAHPMRGPYLTIREGDSDLHRAALAMCRLSGLLPSALVVVVTSGSPKMHQLEASVTNVDVGSALGALSALEFREVASARVPLAVSEDARLHVYRSPDGSDEHYAIEIGRPDRAAPVLCRVHSACFTGDLLGSLKCDCGPQLRGALAEIGREGAGVLLYLNQEGRGIGLANKMRAYALQDQGYDTVEANHRLGFEDDERDFRIGADLLMTMGFSQVRLMTNNPRKVKMMQASGVDVVERVPLQVGHTEHNADYLRTKAEKSGHIL